MATYQYKALNKSGKTVVGYFNAETERQVQKFVTKQGLSCFEISITSDSKKSKIRVNTKTLMLFTKQLSNLLKSNIVIDEAIKLASKQVSQSSFKRLLYDICEKIQEGQRLANVMAHYTHVFSSTYVALVRVGDDSGQLTYVFKNLAIYLEERVKIKQKIVSTLVYPMVLFVFSFGYKLGRFKSCGFSFKA